MAEKQRGNEYSVYAGIDDSPPINWGTIAGTISDQLLTVKKDREAQKQAIEEATVEQMAQLNKLPDVNDRSLSKILIEGSDRSKQELLMRMKLVKSGAIKPKDYTLFMNEQKNGYSEFSNVIKNWDKWYEKKMESIKNGTASAFDKANALSIEAFGNLQNKTIMTNPANGQLQVVTMLKDKDGKYTKMPNAKTNPENFAAPVTLNSRMAFDEEKKVTSELVNKEVAFIGEEIKARSLGNGIVETVEDFTQSAAYPDWKKASIAKLTSNDYDIVQILAEDPRYVIASSQAEFEEKNPGVDLKFFIEMDQSGNNPVPKLREGQKKVAEGMVDTLIESQLGRKETRTQGFNNNENNKNRTTTFKKGGVIIDNLDKVYSGNQAEVDVALDSLYASSGFRYDSFEDMGDYFDVVYYDGENNRKTQRLSKGESKEDFLKAGYSFFQTDTNGAQFNDARNNANVSGSGQSDYAMNEAGERKKFKQNANGEFIGSDGKPTTRRSQFVEAERSKVVNKDGNTFWDGTYKEKGKEYKINKKRKTGSQQRQEAREAITSNSTIGQGSNSVEVSSFYSEIVKKIGDNWGMGSGGGSEGQMGQLEGGIRTAINKAAEAKGDTAAAQNVTVSTSGKIITITAPGKEIIIKSTNDGSLMSKINKAVDEVLGIILPAQASGYSNSGGDNGMG